MTPRVLILAAGQGRRFRACGGTGCKSLTPVAGTSPLAWTLAVLAEAGAPEICVVVGCEAGVIRQAVTATGYPGQITFVTNQSWARTDSAYSFAVGAARTPGPILLTYADVLVTPAIVQRFLASPDRDYLAVDATRPLPAWDMRARVEGDRVAQLGKDLAPADSHGESACVFRFRADTVALIRNRARPVLGTQPSIQFERLLSALLPELPVRPLWCGSGEWCEVDVPADVPAAASLVARVRAARQRAGGR
jgi:choline kinase